MRFRSMISQRHLLTTEQVIYWGYRIRNMKFAKNSKFIADTYQHDI